MSDPAETKSDPAPPAPRGEKVSRPKRWRRRVLIAIGLIALFAMAARGALNLLLPSVLRKVAAGYGLTCDYERVEVSLLSGDAGLWHLNFRPKTGGEPVFGFDYVRGNISLWSLLRGKLDVWRMEADGVNVLLERTADGRVPLLETLLANSAPPPVPSTTSPADRTIDLTPPLKIDAFRLSHLKARLIDRSVTPAYDGTVTMDVRVSDVQSLARPITFAVDLWSDPALDLLRIEGQGRAVRGTVDADVKMLMRGLKPAELAAYLEPMGLRPAGGELSAEGAGKLHLQPATAPSGALSGSLALRDAAIWNDATEVSACDKIDIAADAIDLSGATIASILIDGVRVSANVSKQHALGFAGIELAPHPTTLPAARPAAPADSQDFSASLAKYPVTIKQLAVKNVRATLDDSSMGAPNEFRFDVKDFVANDIVTDPTRHDALIDINGTMRAPGLADALDVKAQIAPFADRRTMRLTFNASGIEPSALQPYFDIAGIKSELRDGSFAAELTGELITQPDGRTTVDAQVTKLRFANGLSSLLEMSDVQLRGAGFDSASGMIRADSIDIAGPSMSARRDASGQISLLGLRTTPAFVQKLQTTAPPSTAPTTRPQAIVLPRLQIGRFTWKDFRLQIQDEMVSPPATITIADAGVELKNLLIDSTAAPEKAAPGSLRMWLSAPGLIQTAAVQGTLTPQPAGLSADLQFATSGITAAAIKPYLLPLGIEPQLSDGQASGTLKFNLAQEGNGIAGALALSEFGYLDGPEELAKVDLLQVSDLSLHPEGLSVGSVQIDRPLAMISRDAQGMLIAGGVKLIPTTRPAAAAAAPSTQPTSAPAEPFMMTLHQLRLNDAQVQWSDQFIPGGAALAANVSAQLDGLTIGGDGAAAPFQARLTIPGAVGQIDLFGAVMTSPNTQGIEAHATGRGIQAGPLAAYLPPGVKLTLRDGRFDANIGASISPQPQGGISAALFAQDVTLADNAAPADPPLLSLGRFSVKASRVDPENAIAIDEVVLDALETDVHLEQGGATRLLGVALAAAAPSAAPAARPAAPTTIPTGDASSADVATLVAASRKPPPLFTLDKLDLNVKRLSLHNDAMPGAAPLTLSGINVKNAARIEVGGEDAANRPPVVVQVSGAIDPIVGRFNVALKSVPLAPESSLSIDIAASGIRGDGLTKLVPPLKGMIDGTGMTDGQFKTHLEMTGKFARRGPAEFDLTKPFDLELTLNGTEFRSAPDSPVLAGLESLHAEAVHVDPKSGGVRIKSLELTKPVGNAWRDKDGVHALGWTFKLPNPATQPATTQPVLVKASPPPPGNAPPPAEMRIDKLLISGLDLRIEDRAVEPPMVVPLNGLDVEVRNLSNLALYEDRPIRFSAMVTSGKAPLASIQRGATAGATDDRELFSQITASGKLSLYPRPTGYAKAAVNGFEMVALRGLAHEQEVSVGKGIFDGSFDLRFPGDGTIRTRSRLAVTDLEVTEPAGGPLQRALQLPGTLDVVIKALQDPDDSITIPLNIDVKNGQVTGGAIAGAAVGAIGSIVATAIASAPLKVAGGVTDMLPFGKKDKAPLEPVELAFAPGVTHLSDAGRQSLDRIVALLQKDKNVALQLRHELGSGDVSRAEARANPDLQECQNLAYRLRSRKLSLLAARAQLGGQVRGVIASGLPAAASQAAVAQLRSVDRDIAETEAALDKVYELMRPGAERQASRRTRAASLELAQDRLDLVKAYLLSAGVPNAADRVIAANATFTQPESPDQSGKIVITIVAKKQQ
jgi:hypothetical protein